MIEKVGKISKNTTELRCTVETDAQTEEEDVPRISLPHLKKIVLDLHIPVQLDDDANPNAILLERKNFNVDKYLFFKQEEDDVNIDCEVILNGCSFFKWSPAEREVIIGFGGVHSEPFLERLKNKKVMKRFNMMTVVDNELAHSE